MHDAANIPYCAKWKKAINPRCDSKNWKSIEDSKIDIGNR